MGEIGVSRGESAEMIAMQHFAKSIDELKDEGFDDILLDTITEDESRMIRAWPRVTRGKPLDDGLIGFEEGEVRTWDDCRFDHIEWARLAGIEERLIYEHWFRLARMNMIYPDGTYPGEIRKFLRFNIEEEGQG